MSGSKDESGHEFTAMFELYLLISPERGEDWFGSRELQSILAVPAYLAGVALEDVLSLSHGVADRNSISNAMGRVYLLAIALDLKKNYGAEVNIDVKEISYGSSKVIATIKTIVKAGAVAGGIIGGVANLPTAAHNAGEWAQKARESITQSTHNIDRVMNNKTEINVQQSRPNPS
jgi:gas vesicle protein